MRLDKELEFNQKTWVILTPLVILTFVYMAKYGFSWVELLINIGLTVAILMLNQPRFRHWIAMLLYGYVALHIHQAHGMTMLHFEVFILLGLLLLYGDWLMVFFNLAIAGIHHFLFFFLQINNVGVYIFPPDPSILLPIEHSLYACVAGWCLHVWVLYPGAEFKTLSLCRRPNQSYGRWRSLGSECGPFLG